MGGLSWPIHFREKKYSYYETNSKQNIDILGGIIMTCAQRMMRIRLMEQMEKSNRTTKEADGTMKYLDKEGNVLVTAKMVRKEG